MCKASFGIAVAAALATSFFLVVGTAAADPYKWCAVYNERTGGGTNCGFITIEQCRATISGIGGICEPNPFYTGPAMKPEKHIRKRHPS